MVAIFLPFLLVITLFGPDVIRLIYERGSFTSESTKAVSTMFLIYSLGILGYVSQELFNKILYLAGKYKYTVIGTVVVITVNVITNFVIISSKLITNVPLVIASTTSVFLTIYAVVISFGIKKVVGPYWKKDLIVDLIKIFLSGLLAFLTYVVFNVFLSEFTHGYLTFVVVLGMCGFVYLASLYFTGVLAKLIKRDKKEKEE
jgi:putative peptidoglycan lipid II flippase